MFTRQWLRAVLRAGGVVLVVPIGLVLAAVLATAVGGGSLDGLGQVLDGPQVPRAQAVAADPDGDRAGELGLPTPTRKRLTPRERLAGRGSSTAAPRSTGGGGRTPGVTPRRPRTPRTTNPVPRPTPGSPPGRTPTSVAPVAPAAPAPPAPAPDAPVAAAPPNVVRGLGKVLDDTVRPLAPPVADAVGSIVDLLAPPR